MEFEHVDGAPGHSMLHQTQSEDNVSVRDRSGLVEQSADQNDCSSNFLFARRHP